MLKIKLAPEPDHFHKKVRTPGMNTLYDRCGLPVQRSGPPRKGPPLAKKIRELPKTDFPDHWRNCIDDLYDAYKGICAYSGIRMKKTEPQVDHYLAKAKHHPILAYEWCNFRLVSPRMNAKKLEYDDVLDPVSIEDDWFIIDFPSFEVHPAKGLNNDIEKKVIATISRLGLSEADCIYDRESYWQLYRYGYDMLTKEWVDPIAFSQLRLWYPFLARELQKNPDYLRDEDRKNLVGSTI